MIDPQILMDSMQYGFFTALAAAVGVAAQVFGAVGAAGAAEDAAAANAQANAMNARATKKEKKASKADQEAERQKLLLSRLEAKRTQTEVLRQTQAARAASLTRIQGQGAGLFGSVVQQANNTISGQGLSQLSKSFENQMITEEVFAQNFKAAEFRRQAMDFRTMGNTFQAEGQNAMAGAGVFNAISSFGSGLVSNAGTFGNIMGNQNTTSFI